jgi:hypothetical protein
VFNKDKHEAIKTSMKHVSTVFEWQLDNHSKTGQICRTGPVFKWFNEDGPFYHEQLQESLKTVWKPQESSKLCKMQYFFFSTYSKNRYLNLLSFLPLGL